MSISSTCICPTSKDQSDSLLLTTVNVISLLTFAYILITGFAYQRSNLTDTYWSICKFHHHLQTLERRACLMKQDGHKDVPVEEAIALTRKKLAQYHILVQRSNWFFMIVPLWLFSFETGEMANLLSEAQSQIEYWEKYQ
jgi:hypothetical protein